MEECVVVISTYSSYIDVCEIFFKLIKKNWPDCPYRMILAVIGEDIRISGVEGIYIGPEGKLTDCVVSVMKWIPANYYLCMLGDAFMNARVNTEEVSELLKAMKEDGIEYCRLKPILKSDLNTVKPYRSTIFGRAYMYGFASFLANAEFIHRELSGISDLEFERKYMRDCEDAKNAVKYLHSAVLIKDIFHIVSGISKGKWDRRNYRIIKRDNPEVACDLLCRKKVSIPRQLRMDIHGMIIRSCSVKTQKKMKDFLGILGMRFVT